MAKLETAIKPWPEEKMAQYQWLEEYLLQQPGTEKVFHPPWQANKYLLRGKMYAYIGLNDKSCRPIITLKLDPAYSEMLRREYPDIVPGYYMNKMNWSTAYLDGGVPKEVLADMVLAAHKMAALALGKKARQELLGE